MSTAVVIPVRNGAALVPECVAAIRAQSVPPTQVLLVVGPSADGTHEVATGLASGDISVIDNPAGDRASAINGALASVRAELVALVDAQARIEPTYLEAAAAVLEDPTIAVAGGPMRPVGRTVIGQAMAAALQSPFGVGDSQFHYAADARDVDSVYLGVYRREVLDQVGRYNTALLRTEDDDLNARIREAGLRIRLDPSIRSTYRCRETLSGIWHQYHGYGYWKVALATVRPSAIRARHFAPAAFALVLGVLLVMAVVGQWLPLLVLSGSWGLAAAGFSAAAPATSLTARLLFPVVALAMHLGYGVGTLQAAVSWRRLRTQVRAAAGESAGAPR